MGKTAGAIGLHLMVLLLVLVEWFGGEQITCFLLLAVFSGVRLDEA